MPGSVFTVLLGDGCSPPCYISHSVEGLSSSMRQMLLSHVTHEQTEVLSLWGICPGPQSWCTLKSRISYSWAQSHSYWTWCQCIYSKLQGYGWEEKMGLREWTSFKKYACESQWCCLHRSFKISFNPFVNNPPGLLGLGGIFWNHEWSPVSQHSTSTVHTKSDGDRGGGGLTSVLYLCHVAHMAPTVTAAGKERLWWRSGRLGLAAYLSGGPGGEQVEHTEHFISAAVPGFGHPSVP